MDSSASSATDLTGEAYNRNSDVRYGAHCPGIIELIFKDGKHFMALTGVIVNLSVTGCLFSNDKMPWSNLEGRKPGDSCLISSMNVATCMFPGREPIAQPGSSVSVPSSSACSSIRSSRRASSG